MTSSYLYAKATALAAKGHTDEARAVLVELEKLATADGDAGLNRVKEVLAVAVLNAKARTALAENKGDNAISLLREAVAMEDQLAYDEPADWFFPTRHLLGAVLIQAGRARNAETVYRDDLSRHPDNGWALYGLAVVEAAGPDRRSLSGASAIRDRMEIHGRDFGRVRVLETTAPYPAHPSPHKRGEGCQGQVLRGHLTHEVALAILMPRLRRTL